MRKYLAPLLLLLMILVPILAGAAALTFAQGNQNTSSAALTVTLDANREIELHWIGIQNTDNAGNVDTWGESAVAVFYILDETDSDYNIELFYQDMNGERGALWVPDHPLRIATNQQVRISVAATTGAEYVYGTICYRPL